MNEFIVSKLKKINHLNKILIDLDTLLDFYLIKPKKKIGLSKIKKDIHSKMISLAKIDRILFGNFFDASQCLPSLHSLNETLTNMKVVENWLNY